MGAQCQPISTNQEGENMANNPAKKTSQSDWNPADIKYALNNAGWTMAALAELHGLTSSTPLSHTFNRSYPINEKRIADAIGVEPHVIWPSRWNADGTQKPRGIRTLQFNAREKARNGRAAAEADKQAVAA